MKVMNVGKVEYLDYMTTNDRLVSKYPRFAIVMLVVVLQMFFVTTRALPS